MITSTGNDRIKNIIKLSTSTKARREQNAFVSEGVKMFIEAPLARIKEVYVSEDLVGKITRVIESSEECEEKDLYEKCRKKLDERGYETVSDQVFNKISDTVTPQGILCVIKKDIQDVGRIIEKNKGKDLRVLVVENIRDPGNLGTMIRTMEAAGFNLMLASEGTVDMYNPKVIRSTMGSVFRVPVVYTGDLARDIGLLKEAGVRVYAAHLKGQRFHNEVKAAGRVAVMIGNEARGLSDEAAALADEYIKIKMHGQVESLNAAVAAAVLMFGI